jgi:hypothetical protein
MFGDPLERQGSLRYFGRFSLIDAIMPLAGCLFNALPGSGANRVAASAFSSRTSIRTSGETHTVSPA